MSAHLGLDQVSYRLSELDVLIDGLPILGLGRLALGTDSLSRCRDVISLLWRGGSGRGSVGGTRGFR